MTLTIKVTAMAGDNIDGVAREMQALADRTGAHIECPFNELKFFAVPGGRADWLATNAWARMFKPRSYNGVFSHHAPDPEDVAFLKTMAARDGGPQA